MLVLIALKTSMYQDSGPITLQQSQCRYRWKTLENLEIHGLSCQAAMRTGHLSSMRVSSQLGCTPRSALRKPMLVSLDWNFVRRWMNFLVSSPSSRQKPADTEEASLCMGVTTKHGLVNRAPLMSYYPSSCYCYWKITRSPDFHYRFCLLRSLVHSSSYYLLSTGSTKYTSWNPETYTFVLISMDIG